MAEEPASIAPGLERKLSTILSADVAGYSRLMAEDEEGTLRVFRGHREVFESLVAMHRGRIFNTAGDAILAEFTSAVEAVRCATEIQAALRSRNDQMPENRQVRFRIGVNLGDVMVHGTDLMGDGVNVAARLQSVAEPGGVIVSGSVYDQIRNKLSLSFQSLGERSYKNIPQPVRTFSITGGEGGTPLPAPKPSRTGGARRAMWAAAAGVAIVAIGVGAWLYLSERGKATVDGMYAGSVCYGPIPNDPARCYGGEATLNNGKLSGEWRGRGPGLVMHVDGEVTGAGVVTIRLRGEGAVDGRRPFANLTGTLNDGRINAAGAFLNGRTVVINWQHN
jgi:class 3 adenylate cyclase